MILREDSDEARVRSVEVKGRSAWESARRAGKPTFFYFKLKDMAYRNGKQPAVQVSITYLDKGNTSAYVQYDSSDGHANAGGMFKEATRFRVKQSGKWKTSVFNLEDARFSGRSNGGDLRVAFVSPDVDPVISEIIVKSLR